MHQAIQVRIEGQFLTFCVNYGIILVSLPNQAETNGVRHG